MRIGGGASTTIGNKRWISLLKPASIVNSGAKDTSTSVELFSLNRASVSDANESKFDVIGEPSTMAALTVPPTIPLYIRRGSLMAIYNNSDSPIAMSFHWKFLLHNLLKFGSLSSTVYQKLECKDRLNVLVTPTFLNFNVFPSARRNEFRTLSNLTLNGTTDWNVYGRDSIVSYEDNTSLEVSTPRANMNIRNLFKRNLKSPFSNKYKVIKGRGNVLLSGNGSVYAIDLHNDTEEIIIKSEYLLAINGINQVHINNSIEQYKLIDPQVEKLYDYKKLSLTVEEAKAFGAKQWLNYFKKVMGSLVNLTQITYFRWLSKPNKFLKIAGPRTVLIQTANNVYMPNVIKNGKSKRTNLSEINLKNINDNSIPNEKESLTKNEERLNQELKYTNIVTIHPKGDVNFKSTKAF
ncbi:hypothetical protein TPHA_0B01480 [Tetrapisispora phaffii CBS 4417]|uniref:Altered inheritance of mitochondria protein 24, mitochondrial n=1 Tax=Tetrapisispora phaffii (strain ATCC 24235 / CBS 4417 / NBRC 1672 / NRRL Y-8282 / UCD 70-5) TaxID=1071381 RepID=G8BP90_TETPH|nr:hypothetical protein TPHA_0B01480 [Tetrapisispora phaffii CBS 4417]CCE61821.1 hypothetical protein TPHA_0B01480 [Tetrapisispora phaffii CBS 4417]